MCSSTETVIVSSAPKVSFTDHSWVTQAYLQVPGQELGEALQAANAQSQGIDMWLVFTPVAVSISSFLLCKINESRQECNSDENVIPQFLYFEQKEWMKEFVWG